MLDIVAIIFILFGFYIGFKRGIIKTVFDTVSILIAILASLKLSPLIIGVITKTFQFSAGVNFILGFVLTFFIVMLLIRFIGGRLEGILKAVNLNFINKIAGGALLGGVFAVGMGYLTYLGSNLSLISDEAKQTSITYPLLSTLPSHSQALFQQVKPIFTDFWELTVETMDEIKQKGDQLQ